MSKKRKTSAHTSSSKPPHKSRKARKQSSIWLWVGLGLTALVILVAATLLWPKTSLSNEITTSQAYQKYQQGAFFLDVRTQVEWDQAHIANSTLIPLDELKSRLGELPRDQDIVVVCLSGHRSQEGMKILSQAGFKRASCITGGLSAWKAAGYPLEGSKP